MNILIIGLGSIAKKHIKVLKELVPHAKISALRNSETAEKTEGITNVYKYDDLLTEEYDFAIISNPTYKHKEAISNLTKFKIPLFIEKPLFSDLDADDLLNTIRENNIQTYIACNLRFLESISFVKEFIKGKRINEVNIYCGSYLPDWRPDVDFRKVYSANKEMGGGVHIDLIHELDYAYWLFGNPEKISVVKTSQSGLHINSIDYANYTLNYKGFCAGIILNYYRIDAKRSLEILTSQGTITVDLLKNEVRFNGEVIFLSNQRIIDTYKNQMGFFINEILVNKQKFNDIHEAYQILKLCIRN